MDTYHAAHLSDHDYSSLDDEENRYRAREGFVCVAEFRVAMIQNAASTGHAFDMMIKFIEQCFQISFVKIPS